MPDSSESHGGSSLLDALLYDGPWSGAEPWPSPGPAVGELGPEPPTRTAEGP